MLRNPHPEKEGYRGLFLQKKFTPKKYEKLWGDNKCDECLFV